MNRAELIARIREQPTDERVLVYADWLQSHDDPLGEHIVVSHALEQRADLELEKQRDRLRALHPKAIFGELDEHLDNVRLIWSRGLIIGAELDGAVARVPSSEPAANLPARLTNPGPFPLRIVRQLVSAPASVTLRSVLLARVSNAEEIIRELERTRGLRDLKIQRT